MQKIMVDNQHPEYKVTAILWQRARDAVAGEQAIYEACVKNKSYLPALKDENAADYAARLRRAGWFNATSRTLEGMAGSIFRKDPVYESVDAMAQFFENIDMAGRHIDSFAERVVKEVLMVGRCGVLVDYPADVPDTLTVADQELRGLRPYAKIYTAESIINWRAATTAANQEKLALVVLEEQAGVAGSEFGHDCRTIYRVLDLFDGFYRQRIMSIDDKGIEITEMEIFPMIGSARMTEIPFEILGGICVEKPPLDDLISVNLHHFHVSADYEHGVHKSGLPTLVISGENFEPGDAVYLGGSQALILRSESAKAYFVEIQSNFEALRQNLLDKKAEMAILGARMLEAQRAGVEAAETVARRQSGEMSVLASIAKSASASIEKILGWVAAWAGIRDPRISYQLNRDYLPGKAGPQEIVALVSLWQSGVISGRTLHANLQEGEIIPTRNTYEDEQEDIRNDQLPRGGNGKT